MLNYLIKHEIKTTGRMMAIIYSIFAVSTLLVSIFCLPLRFRGIDLTQGIYAVPLIIYGATVFLLIAVGFIYLCYQFYQTMYAEQGYLTHTLPVVSSTILHTKIVVSAGFLMVSCIVCMFSIAVTLWAVTGQGFGDMVKFVGQTVTEIAQMSHLSKAGICFYGIAGFVVSCFTSLLLFFAGSSIGQLFHRSKGGAGIAAGIALYYITQIVSVLIVGVCYLLYRGFGITYDVQWAMGGSFLLLLLWTVIYYVICRIIVRKHLNLA